MIYRPLGKTGVWTSALALGGESALYRRGPEAARIIDRAYGLGINYFDTAPLYAESELNLGDVLPSVRNGVFIATKTDRRDYDGAWRQFEESLQRLRTDHVDLLQIHHLDLDEELGEIFASSGAVRMLHEAKEQGLARFVGVTGHSDPDVLLTAINRYPFDTILMALNPAEVHVHSFQKRLLPRAVELEMGVMAMKVLARGEVFRFTPGVEPPIRYALTLPTSNVVLGVMNEAQLERDAEVVSRFQPLRADEIAAIEDAASLHAQEVNYYRKGLIETAPFPTPETMTAEVL
jgi:aryl-alcohol dehydrogenase-like predicted oxidoreductase